MVIFWTNCGTKLDDEDAFCMNCGTKVYDGFKKDKNSSSASIGEDNIYIKNVDLLTRNGIGGHMYRGDFIEFLKKRNLSFDNDLITQKIVDDYFAENIFLKNDVLKNKQKSFRNVADYNVNLLKENGFGGASERGGFITFMKSSVVFGTDRPSLSNQSLRIRTPSFPETAPGSARPYDFPSTVVCWIEAAS